MHGRRIQLTKQAQPSRYSPAAGPSNGGSPVATKTILGASLSYKGRGDYATVPTSLEGMQVTDGQGLEKRIL